MVRRCLACVVPALLLASAGVQAATVWPKEAARIVAGLRFTEGPTWHPDGALLFSDIPANRIYRWEEGKEPAVFREPSHHSNGLAMDAQGRLVACEHGARRVTRTERDGTLTVLAERYEGKRLNSPNDLTLHSRGAIYFTDPPYGLRGKKGELGFCGVYRIAPDGRLQLLVRDLGRPNGIALSPDETRLYVADSQQRFINVYEVQDDGTVAHGRQLAHLGKAIGTRVIDGMATDEQGNLYATCTGAVAVVSPEGKVLATIACPTEGRTINTTNCCFGGPHRRTLFITAGPNVFRVRMPIAGRALD